MNVHLEAEEERKLKYILSVANGYPMLSINVDQMKKCCLFIQSNMHKWTYDERIAASKVYYALSDRLIRSRQQRELVSKLDVGTYCPTCNRFMKRYKRKLNSGMSRTLIWLYHYQRESGKHWVRVADAAPTYVLRTNEISRLVLWGLV